MNIRDRLMSRASVAAMAAFAPKPEGGLPAGAERVEDAGGGGDMDDMGLSADEQAAFDAMQAGREPGGKEDIVQGGEDDGDGEADPEVGEGDGEADGGESADAAPGEKDASAAAADGSKPPPKTISYGKYQREQAKTKKALEDLQAKLDGATRETAKEREQRTRLDERTRLLLEAIQTKQPAAEKKDDDPEPDAESDPIGNLQWNNRRLRAEVDGLRTGTQKAQEQTAAEREETQVYRTYEADLMREAQTDPTFGDAFNHLRETRYTELGYIYADVDINDKVAVDAALTPDQQVELSENIQRTFHNEQMLVARQAIQSRKSPAQVVKNLARARGFVPKAAQQEPAAGKPVQAAKPGNGAAPPVQRQPPGSVKDQLQAIRDGQESARSLSDAGGSPGGSITPERLAEMPDDEFMEIYETMKKGQFDRLMGKPATQ